ncbi:hypothetical protein KR026_009263 [Drosophila bipectinata]|nr:hypothetical protein KR026_009263 [Drosophila bipectinata]
MKFYGIACLLMAIFGCLFATSLASPSRHSGPGPTIYKPPPPGPAPRPFYYDSPIPRLPNQPRTMYA